MNNYQSIATINAPEFINLEPLDINPGMAKCEIKVLYLGNNRNGTSINKEAATSMAKSLRGAPIVGYYRAEKGDFFDHGEQIIYDGDGVHFNSLTKPYGFVSPDAQVWFQDFQETDEMGVEVTRTYMMTTGYLWVGQYEEAGQVFLDGGKPHSMELDENSLTGFWSKDENSNCEFFIINDAIFSKLCMLGDDVEPCFEGSSITAPNISKNFTLDKEFTRTLYQMMTELQQTLKGGEKTVEDELKKKSNDSSAPITPAEPAQVAEENTTPTGQDNPSNTSTETNNSTEAPAENNGGTTPGETTATIDSGENSGEGGNSSEEGGNSGESGGDTSGSGDGDGGSDGSGSSDYTKKDDEDDKKSDEDKEDKKDDGEDKKEDDDDEDTKKKYSLIVEQLNEIQASFAALQTEHQKTLETLAQFQKVAEAAEMEKKDALIAEFSMLSDEDKKDVIEHKAEYSLETIKSKLAVMCFDKKVSYTVAPKEEAVTVSIDTTSQSAMPEWLKAVEERRKEQ